MLFKFLVLGFLFLEFLHNWWLEDTLKDIAKHYNIHLRKYYED